MLQRKKKSFGTENKFLKNWLRKRRKNKKYENTIWWYYFKHIILETTFSLVIFITCQLNAWDYARPQD